MRLSLPLFLLLACEADSRVLKAPKTTKAPKAPKAPKEDEITGVQLPIPTGGTPVAIPAIPTGGTPVAIPAVPTAPVKTPTALPSAFPSRFPSKFPSKSPTIMTEVPSETPSDVPSVGATVVSNNINMAMTVTSPAGTTDAEIEALLATNFCPAIVQLFQEFGLTIESCTAASVALPPQRKTKKRQSLNWGIAYALRFLSGTLRCTALQILRSDEGISRLEAILSSLMGPGFSVSDLFSFYPATDENEDCNQVVPTAAPVTIITASPTTSAASPTTSTPTGGPAATSPPTGISPTGGPSNTPSVGPSTTNAPSPAIDFNFPEIPSGGATTTDAPTVTIDFNFPEA